MYAFRREEGLGDLVPPARDALPEGRSLANKIRGGGGVTGPVASSVVSYNWYLLFGLVGTRSGTRAAFFSE